ncbi:DUF1440 domain-containing protein [Granulicella sibirica]|uniref:DUF1440 domain-containing protein n=1 Tax=Granulicella sibirica TaxID=2479048 RepID=A0A4Q0T0W0_9BACT|nr:DUF1440 domain-containing protein [Granulicella sibirica]RXH56777.1 hypothetical protein GRAN_0087 [Granulicella sibirica]
MSEVAVEKPTETRSLLKGLFAGLIGGLAGAAAKTVAEKIYPPRVHGEPEPSEVVIEKATDGEASDETKEIGAEAIHWAFGAMAGAAYGGLVEYYPAASSKEGASFGLTLAALTHGGALPAMGLGAAPEDQTAQEKTSEMSSHLVYGVVTEIVRGMVRKML